MSTADNPNHLKSKLKGECLGETGQAEACTPNGDEFEDRWAGVCATAAKYKMRPEDVDCFLRAKVDLENLPKNPAARRSMLNYLKKNEYGPPKWMEISGFYPELRHFGDDRRQRLRHLHQSVVALIRRELKRFEADPFKEERTVYWDPTAEVCAHLEISQSKLSAMLKEFNGNSLAQTVDCVRVEGVRVKMKEMLVGVVGAAVKRTEGTEGTQGEKDARGATLGRREKALEVWKEIRKERRWPEFSLNTWANEMGFASYRRMYRACIAMFRKTPHQMELEVIGEILCEARDAGLGDLTQRHEGTEARRKEVREYTLEEVEEMVRRVRPFEWKSEEVMR